ncbi:hypothetical protein BDA99DRAFT_537531 [Phascolomyces articulosus]|uniref:Uncharacterized protein n=1 Tax=Phascolomyces articulosus TaxID=60185 RepID=A0AAD5K9M1_9FUNG|nr:hypothetical protein BDA99DRAFT_537531 [Phascolomyces articulosus]
MAKQDAHMRHSKAPLSNALYSLLQDSISEDLQIQFTFYKDINYKDVQNTNSTISKTCCQSLNYKIATIYIFLHCYQEMVFYCAFLWYKLSYMKNNNFVNLGIF